MIIDLIASCLLVVISFCLFTVSEMSYSEKIPKMNYRGRPNILAISWWGQDLPAIAVSLRIKYACNFS